MDALKDLQSMAQYPSRDQARVVSLRSQYWGWRCLMSLLVTWTVGLSALSVLDNIKLSSAGSMLEGRDMSSRGTLTGLRGELVHFSCISRRPSASPAAGVLGQSQVQVMVWSG